MIPISSRRLLHPPLAGLRRLHPPPRRRPQFSAPRRAQSNYNYDPPAAPAPRRRSRYRTSLRRPLLYSALAFLPGYMTYLIFPDIPVLPDFPASSPQDLAARASIREDADKIPLIAWLLEESSRGGWKEVRMHSSTPEAQEWADEDGAGNSMLDMTLRGSFRLLLPRAFWNPTSREFIMAVHYGDALSGWPKVAHGGCTATVLLEGMGRAVACSGGEEAGRVKAPDPGSLELTYVTPVWTGETYVMKVGLEEVRTVKEEESAVGPDAGPLGSERDLVGAVRGGERGSGVRGRRVKVRATIENSKGVVCVKCKGDWEHN